MSNYTQKIANKLDIIYPETYIGGLYAPSPIMYDIDKDKANNYINAQEKYKEFISSVIHLTRHISCAELYAALQITLNTFKQRFALCTETKSLPEQVHSLAITNKKIFILWPKGKIGSEHWLIARSWDILKTMNYEFISDPVHLLEHKNTNNFDILIIDDCIYSGNNVSSHIDNLTYDYGKILGLKQKEIANKFIFHIAVPYIVEDGDVIIRNNLRCYNFEMIFYKYESIPNLESRLRSSGHIMSMELYPMASDDFCFESDPAAIYFDHKVANEFGSLPQIYLRGDIPDKEQSMGCILQNSPDRSHINRITKILNV